VRRLGNSGFLKWHGAELRVAKLLAREPVGLKQTDDDEWELHYGSLLIGYVLRRDGKTRIEPIA
jgi:hypothetical protein